MSTNTTDNVKKVTTATIRKMKAEGEKVAMINAYDYTMATLVDAGGVDMILVGDSASNVMVGNATTLPMTVDQMIYHGRCVTNGVKRALVVIDMPFGSYQGNPQVALASAIRIMKETGADAEIAESVKLILSAGIPIVAHLGLTPQSINKFGSYAVRAKEEAEAERLLSDAHLMEDLGCFALVLEKIPAALAKRVTAELGITVIGIGAGSDTDGQVLVLQDMLGMNPGFKPKFLRVYASVGDDITRAIAAYTADVKSAAFPSPEESY